MRPLGDASDRLSQSCRSLEREWDHSSGAWRDARQQEFERTIITPILRDTSTMVREMEAAAEIVAGALRLL
ncbi:MAG: hypothetical protein JWO77_3249 [Ilumatobacteraceae bacterium]|nr:hypothetical protein [Ilumatobacteraceae bacterium]